MSPPLPLGPGPGPGNSRCLLSVYHFLGAAGPTLYLFIEVNHLFGSKIQGKREAWPRVSQALGRAESTWVGSSPTVQPTPSMTWLGDLLLSASCLSPWPETWPYAWKYMGAVAGGHLPSLPSVVHSQEQHLVPVRGPALSLSL